MRGGGEQAGMLIEEVGDLTGEMAVRPGPVMASSNVDCTTKITSCLLVRDGSVRSTFTSPPVASPSRIMSRVVVEAVTNARASITCTKLESLTLLVALREWCVCL